MFWNTAPRVENSPTLPLICIVDLKFMQTISKFGCNSDTIKQCDMESNYGRADVNMFSVELIHFRWETQQVDNSASHDGLEL